nr:uncharacterized protein LOC129452627 [Misgurnus anguillicaudatus]
MKTTPLLFFYLLLCCQSTESLTKKQVNLGGNVTLDCDIDVKDIYWLFLKPSKSLVVILRTNSTSAMFIDQRLRNKYSPQNNSSLFISNITKDELGVYYCAKLHSIALKLSNGTKLYISEVAYKNETEDNDQLQHSNTTTTQHSALTLATISLNVLLPIIIIGLLMARCRKPRKGAKPQPNAEVELEQIKDLNTAKFAEVEFRLCD